MNISDKVKLLEELVEAQSLVISEWEADRHISAQKATVRVETLKKRLNGRSGLLPRIADHAQ